jgi:hypothetical protein
MSENLSNFLWGTVCLVAGALILHNLDSVVRFDQVSGTRLKGWFNKQLGKSVLNRELWSVGTPNGFRSSRIVFRVVAIVAILFGVLLIGFSFRSHFH